MLHFNLKVQCLIFGLISNRNCNHWVSPFPPRMSKHYTLHLEDFDAICRLTMSSFVDTNFLVHNSNNSCTTFSPCSFSVASITTHVIIHFSLTDSNSAFECNNRSLDGEQRPSFGATERLHFKIEPRRTRRHDFATAAAGERNLLVPRPGVPQWGHFLLMHA